MSTTVTLRSDAFAAAETRVVLLVDDEPDIRETLAVLIETYVDSVRVLTAGSAHEGREILRQHPVDLIISDFRMPEVDGLTFLKWARDMAPDVPRVMITAYPRLDMAMRAVDEGGIHQYIMKPFLPEEILDLVRRAMRPQELKPLGKSEVDRLFRRGQVEGTAAA